MKKRTVFILCICSLILLNIYPLIDLLKNNTIGLFGIFNIIGLIIFLFILNIDKDNSNQLEYHKKHRKAEEQHKDNMKVVKSFVWTYLALSIIFIILSLILD